MNGMFTISFNPWVGPSLQHLWGGRCSNLTPTCYDNLDTHTWGERLLPYLEANSVYEQIDFSNANSSPNNYGTYIALRSMSSRQRTGLPHTRRTQLRPVCEFEADCPDNSGLSLPLVTTQCESIH